LCGQFLKNREEIFDSTRVKARRIIMRVLTIMGLVICLFISLERYPDELIRCKEVSLQRHLLSKGLKYPVFVGERFNARYLHFLTRFTYFPIARAEELAKPDSTVQEEYTVGVDDVLEISILRPEKIVTTVIVAPDGSISVPYIGNVEVKGLTLSQIQSAIQTKLADGYMKYPVISVSLKASRSRKFFVYGEVVHPGAYPIEENVTVLKAISMAGGFTKFGSANKVKVLRLKKGAPGYQMIKVNIKAVMNGSLEADITLEPGDIVVVSQGIF